MKKNVVKFLALSSVAVLIAFTGFGCGSKSSSSGPDIAASVTKASDALAANDPLNAKANCVNVLKSDPNNCSCQWIYTLADVQDLAQNQLQVVINNLETGLIGDNIASLFTGVSMDLSDIPTRTSVIEANACEFTMPTVPVTVQLDFSSLQSLASLSPSLGGLLSALPATVTEQLAFGSQWGPSEAKVLGSASNGLLAVINILSAHALDTSDLITILTGSGLPSLSLSDPIGLVRGLGSLFEQAPKLLAFNNQGTGPQDITNAGTELNAALKEITGLNASLQADQGNANKVIAYTDVNGDGEVDGGDTFTLGALYYTNGTWENLAGQPLTLPAMISNQFMPALDALLAKLSDNLTSGSPDIVPMDINDVLASVGMTAASFQTNVLSLNPHALFANPVPLRTFFPTVANNQFQVEAEVTATTSGVPWYYMAGDAQHFTDGTNAIQADGISVPLVAGPFNLLGMSIPAMIPYVSFNDPTFDGVVSVDLSQMLTFCEPSGACPAATPAGFSPATLYSFDKVIAGGIYGLFTDSTTGLPITTVNPIW